MKKQCAGGTCAGAVDASKAISDVIIVRGQLADGISLRRNFASYRPTSFEKRAGGARVNGLWRTTASPL